MGSAPRTRAWVLIEHPGPWRIKAFPGSDIRADVRRAIDEAAGQVGARILLIRRPGRRYPRDQVLRWAVARPRRKTHWGTWNGDDDLLGIVDVLATDTEEYPHPLPLLLVCTHGIHDRCCALRGRPVAADLARAYPEQTWECSHLGGDRFAANLLIAPQGVYYGGLDGGADASGATDAVTVVREHLAGRISPDHFRGSTLLPPPAQVAFLAVQREFGPGSVDAVRVKTLHRATDVPHQCLPPGSTPEEDERTTERRTPERWTVQLMSDLPGPDDLTVTVERRVTDGARRTCRADGDALAVEWDVISLR